MQDGILCPELVACGKWEGWGARRRKKNSFFKTFDPPRTLVCKLEVGFGIQLRNYHSNISNSILIVGPTSRVEVLFPLRLQNSSEDSAQILGSSHLFLTTLFVYKTSFTQPLKYPL